MKKKLMHDKIVLRLDGLVTQKQEAKEELFERFY